MNTKRSRDNDARDTFERGDDKVARGSKPASPRRETDRTQRQTDQRRRTPPGDERDNGDTRRETNEGEGSKKQDHAKDTESSSEDLPDGWSSVMSKSRGKCFYFHRASNTTSWDKPTADNNPALKKKANTTKQQGNADRAPPSGPASARSIPPSGPRSDSSQEARTPNIPGPSRDMRSTFTTYQPRLGFVDRVHKCSWQVYMT